MDARHKQALAAGAKVWAAPESYPYGERQYTAQDLAGHVWTFSQTVANTDPTAWGGTPIQAQTQNAP